MRLGLGDYSKREQRKIDPERYWAGFPPSEKYDDFIEDEYDDYKDYEDELVE